jgi:hypothetical protein
MKKIIILLCSLFLLTAPLYSQVNLDSLLVAYYPFNGNAIDESGNGNDGTVFGATLVDDRFSNPNGAYSFNGFTDYIEFGDVFNDVFVPFAISAWIYKEQVGTPNQCIIKSDNYPGTGTTYYYGFWLTTVDDAEQTTVGISYGDGGEPDPLNRRTKVSASTIYLDQWVHIVVNVNGPDDMAIYFNAFDVGGTYSGTGGNMVHSGWTANMGRNTLPPNVYLYGMLDDIRIYDRILTLDEITALYEEQNPVGLNENQAADDPAIVIHQIFPNPCADVARIRYRMPDAGCQIIGIFSIDGRRIRELVHREVSPGEFELDIDMSDLPPGMYFLRSRLNNHTTTQKLIKLKN